MMKLLFAVLETDIIEDHSQRPPEGGTFAVEVFLDTLALRQSPDPRRYLMREIAIHLKQAILDTEVPREHWHCTFTSEVHRRWDDFPSQMRMG